MGKARPSPARRNARQSMRIQRAVNMRRRVQNQTRTEIQQLSSRNRKTGEKKIAEGPLGPDKVNGWWMANWHLEAQSAVLDQQPMHGDSRKHIRAITPVFGIYDIFFASLITANSNEVSDKATKLASVRELFKYMSFRLVRKPNYEVHYLYSPGGVVEDIHYVTNNAALAKVIAKVQHLITKKHVKWTEDLAINVELARRQIELDDERLRRAEAQGARCTERYWLRP